MTRPEELPPQVRDVVQRESLVVEEVNRNGPRFWVGKVRSGEKLLIAKAVIDDQPWHDPGTGWEFRPSDLLSTEIAVTAALGPQVWLSADDGRSWFVRAIVPGAGLAAGASTLQAHGAMFEDSVTAALVEFVLSYQALTTRFRGLLEQSVGTKKARLKPSTAWYDLQHPAEPVKPYASAIAAMAERHEELHDRRIDTLVHGELYPAHIMLHDGKVGLIDWENARLDNSLSDFVTLWSRGFDRPEWQQRLMKELEARGVLVSDEDRALWDLEVLLQAAGNLKYLHYSKLEPPELRERAAAAFSGYIERAVA
jgi:aminoglycoside phosphotransferase (APT) family kinase protein